MSSFLERLALILFFILGLNTFSITHAKAEEETIRECPISGQVTLKLNGTPKNGQLIGWVNNQSVWWSVFSGRVLVFIDGRPLSLILETDRKNEYLLSGWIGENHIRWNSNHGVFNEWIYCH